jgi:hypothetical protein
VNFNRMNWFVECYCHCVLSSIQTGNYFLTTSRIKAFIIADTLNSPTLTPKRALRCEVYFPLHSIYRGGINCYEHISPKLFSKTHAALTKSVERFARVLSTPYLPVLIRLQQSFTRKCLILLFQRKISIRKQWKVIYLPS